MSLRCVHCYSPILMARLDGKLVYVDRQQSIEGIFNVVETGHTPQLIAVGPYRIHTCPKPAPEEFDGSRTELARALRIASQEAPKQKARRDYWWAAQVLSRELQRLAKSGSDSPT